MTAKKATPYQLAVLTKYMRDHPVLASGQYGKGLQHQIQADKQWKELAGKLHAVSGPTKSIAKWKQTWRDLRLSLKKASLPQEGTDTGNSKYLSTIKEQGLDTMGHMAFIDIEGVPNTESERKPSIFVVSPATPTTQIPPPASSSTDNPKIRKRIITKRRAMFAERLLKLEEEKVAAKRAHYAAMQKIEEERLTVQKEHYAALREIDLKKADGLKGFLSTATKTQTSMKASLNKYLPLTQAQYHPGKGSYISNNNLQG